MAVQAHNIPWTLFASKFKYKDTDPKYWGITNYYAKPKPHPGKDISFFVNAVAKTIEEHSTCERRKYADEYSRPDSDVLIINEEVSQKISRTVHRYRAANSDPKTRICTFRLARRVCTHQGPDSQCQCPVRYEDRKASMFSLAPMLHRQFWGCDGGFEARYNDFEYTAMIKTLLLYGEMDILFTLAAYNTQRLTNNWEICWTNCQKSEQGWREVRDLALYPFICLNMLYAMRMDSGHDDEPLGQDYRRTKAYQVMLLRCTGEKKFGCYLQESAFDPETFPHRQFFGVYRGQYENTQYIPHAILDHKSDTFYGKVPLYKLEKRHCLSNYHRPTVSDVDDVAQSLREFGLPEELVLDILERADYRWQRRLQHSDHPMHLKNREELLKYLKFCWILLVRCDLLAKACGKRIDWVNEVSLCIDDLFGLNIGAIRRVEPNLGERDNAGFIDGRPDLTLQWLSP